MGRHARLIASYTLADGLLSGQVAVTALDSPGNVFFANDTCFYAPGQRRDGGLSVRRADGTWTSYICSSGLPGGGDPGVLFVDSADTLWIGTDVITAPPTKA